MPIKQERMLKLIYAAKDYKQALDRMVLLVEEEARGCVEGRQTYQSAIENISITAQPLFLLNSPLESASTISIEAAYFKSNERRNAKAAEWQAAKRAKLRGHLAKPREDHAAQVQGRYKIDKKGIEEEADRALQDAQDDSAFNQVPHSSDTPAPYESGEVLGEDFPDDLTVTSEEQDGNQ